MAPARATEDAPAYCEAALPVPLDRTFTYGVPGPMRARVRPGCRVLVPFARRTLNGVVLATHNERPDYAVLNVKRVLDEDPALAPELIDLARWVSGYYCTPIGEVLKSMLPLSGETRTSRVAELTEAGRAEAESILALDTVDASVLASLKKKPLTLAYLSKKHPGAADALKDLAKRGLVVIKQVVEERDPTRSRDAILLVRAGKSGNAPDKLGAGERWLLSFLKRNPGNHDLRALSVQRPDVVRVARKLARSGSVHLEATRKARESWKSDVRFVLNGAQRDALEAIVSALRANSFHPFLLHGVTGSGKTEVYLRAVEEALGMGRTALALVPEIGLTPVLASRFFERFGDRVAILHSGLSDAQRSDQWRRIRTGRARAVLGTRSAVFAPLADIGLVIVDEEHDASYKQGEAPRYNGRDIAVVRARSAGAVAVLGSATPGIESRHNAETGKYALLQMPHRIMERPLPAVRKVDMRKEFAETGQNSLFSRELAEAVRACLSKGEQAVILLNRRGYSTYVLCRSCGQRVECPNCSVTLTYHKRDKRLLCHHCDHFEAVPKLCGRCGRDFLHFHGSGSEKVEDELKSAFPDARIARLDRDTVRGRDHFENVLTSFREHACNLLVGTQMIAKGHDIPNVTLVCVVDADVGLGRPDFRAAERTFQLLTQVAGRAGRGEKPGQVLIQTMNPDHYAVDLAAGQDYEAFYRKEVRFREDFWYPPFTAVATIIVRSRELSEAVSMSNDLGKHLEPAPEGMRLLGPLSAPVVRLRTEYRFQFLIKSVSRSAIGRLLKKARGFAESQRWRPTAMVIDVDPVDFL